jgi:hypothetical protein
MRIDDGHKALDAIAGRVEKLTLENANEAETRIKVVDEVLRSVLGWLLDDISVEESADAGGNVVFCDYVLRTASTALLVEAKKVGASFSFSSQRTSLKLGGVLREGEVGAAIRQAQNYCQLKSIPFAAVTNGSSWIVFPAVRTDGVTFEDSEAVIFRTLLDVKSRMVEFWELLSRERVAEGNLEDTLITRRPEGPTTRCVRRELPEPGYRLGRNALYEHLEPAIATALTDEALLTDPKALEQCYVKTSERHKYDSRLRMYLHDIRPDLGQASARLTNRGDANPLREVVTKPVVTPPRFLVVLGPVGAGKTTFLHFTREVSAATEIDGKILWVLLDFKKATGQDNVRRFVYQQLRDAIDNDIQFDLGDWVASIRPAYRTEVENLKRGVLQPLAKADPAAFEQRVSDLISKERDEFEPYVEKILKHSSSRRPTYLIFDNVDQIEDEEFQSSVFLEAQAVARKTGSNAIISLRETTFLRHRGRPQFDAFQFELFYLDPPTIPPVLSRRLEYAKRVLKGKSVDLTTESGIRVAVPDLGEFFEIFGKSLLADRSGAMLEALSGGDIRRGLMLVREFLASGHTNADRAILAFLKDGDYRFPIHEVFKGAVLGNRRHYDDSISLVPNIYDSKLGTSELQSLRLRLTSLLVERATSPGFEGCPFQELRAGLSQQGISERDSLASLTSLLQGRVVRTSDGLALSDGSRLLPTRLGAYLLRTAACEFAYNEFCSLDAVIFDDDVWGGMRELTRDIESTRDSVERMELRLKRLNVFTDYLVRQEDRWVVDAKRRHLDEQWCTTPVRGQILPALAHYLPKVLDSARRNRR